MNFTGLFLAIALIVCLAGAVVVAVVLDMTQVDGEKSDRNSIAPLLHVLNVLWWVVLFLIILAMRLGSG